MNLIHSGREAAISMSGVIDDNKLYTNTLNAILADKNKKYFSYFSTKTYVVGTQKNRLFDTVLLSTKNMLKLMGKKILTTLH